MSPEAIYDLPDLISARENSRRSKEECVQGLAVPPSVHVGFPGFQAASGEHAAVHPVVVNLGSQGRSPFRRISARASRRWRACFDEESFAARSVGRSFCTVVMRLFLDLFLDEGEPCEGTRS